MSSDKSTPAARLSSRDVLQAVEAACAGWSIYISSELRQRWKAEGRDTNEIRAATVLRHLRSLERQALVACTSERPMGYYGFRWTLTERGRTALAEPAHG